MSDNSQEKSDDIVEDSNLANKVDETAKDKISSLVETAAGELPIIGSLVSELISQTIPNQRIDRIADMLKKLDDKISKLENSDEALSNLEKPENIDLLEDSIEQASKSLKEEKREQIATMLKNGITDEELEHIQKKTLLSILEELNEIEILKLRPYGLHPQKSRKFRKEHEDVLSKPLPTFDSDQSEIEKAAVYERFENHLVSLGLLDERFDIPDDISEVEFDEDTGKLESKGYKLTSLGRLFLRYLDYEVER